MNNTTKSEWCATCYRRVQYAFIFYVIGGFGMWTGHDPKCPRHGRAPKHDG